MFGFLYKCAKYFCYFEVLHFKSNANKPTWSKKKIKNLIGTYLISIAIIYATTIYISILFYQLHVYMYNICAINTITLSIFLCKILFYMYFN